MLDIATIIILIFLGIGAGSLGSMLGVGGGIIIVPALTIMGFSPSHIAATSLFAVTSTSASSTMTYSKQKRIDAKMSIKMAIPAIPGAIIGALVSGQIPIDVFKVYFAILLMLTGIYILFKSSILKEHAGPKKGKYGKDVIVYSSSFLAGIISSLFGVGGGIVFVPLMILVFGMKMHRAAPTSQLTLLITSLAGLIAHASLGHPDYAFALALAGGAFVGAQIGARYSLAVKEKLLQQVLAIVLIAVAIKFIIDWLGPR